MTVAHILANKGGDIISVSPADSLKTVIDLLEKRKIGATVVLDDKGRLAGIVSERDVVREFARNGGDALKQAVSDVMTKKVVTCGRNDSIAQVMGFMTDGKFRHLPVMDENTLVGIISIGDVVKQRIAEIESERQAMQDYIATG